MKRNLYMAVAMMILAGGLSVGCGGSSGGDGASSAALNGTVWTGTLAIEVLGTLSTAWIQFGADGTLSLRSSKWGDLTGTYSLNGTDLFAQVYQQGAASPLFLITGAYSASSIAGSAKLYTSDNAGGTFQITPGPANLVVVTSPSSSQYTATIFVHGIAQTTARPGQTSYITVGRGSHTVTRQAQRPGQSALSVYADTETVTFSQTSGSYRKYTYTTSDNAAISSGTVASDGSLL